MIYRTAAVIPFGRYLLLTLVTLFCLAAQAKENRRPAAETTYGGYLPLPAGIFNVNIIGQMYKNGQCQGAVSNKINIVKGLDTALYWNEGDDRVALLAQIKMTVVRTLGLAIADTSALYLSGLRTYYGLAPEQIADFQKNNAYVIEAIGVSQIRIDSSVTTDVIGALGRYGLDTLEDLSCKRDQKGITLKFKERILFAAIKTIDILSEQKQVYTTPEGNDTLVIDNPDNSFTLATKRERLLFSFSPLPNPMPELVPGRERYQACLMLNFERVDAGQNTLSGQAIICPQVDEITGSTSAAMGPYYPARQYGTGKRRAICSTLDGNTITTYVFTLVSQQVEYAAPSALTKPGSYKPKRVKAKLLFETHRYTCKMSGL